MTTQNNSIDLTKLEGYTCKTDKYKDIGIRKDDLILVDTGIQAIKNNSKILYLKNENAMIGVYKENEEFSYMYSLDCSDTETSSVYEVDYLGVVKGFMRFYESQND